AEFYEESTIVSSGLSKWCGAGGWRLGAFSIPKPLRALADAIAAMGSETYSATCAPVQYAAVRAFELGTEIEQYLDGPRRGLTTRRSRAAQHSPAALPALRHVVPAFARSRCVCSKRASRIAM